jgi:hypothetical protein
MSDIPTDEQVRDEAKISKDVRIRLELMILDRLEHLSTIVVFGERWSSVSWCEIYEYIRDYEHE